MFLAWVCLYFLYKAAFQVLWRERRLWASRQSGSWIVSRIAFIFIHRRTCVLLCTHTHTNKHTVIITEKPESVQAGSVPSFLCLSNILSFCLLSFGVGYFFALFFPVCSYTQRQMHRNHQYTWCSRAELSLFTMCLLGKWEMRDNIYWSKKESKVRKRGLIDGVKGICEAVTMRHSIYRGQRPTQRQRVSARWLLEIPLSLCWDTKVAPAMSLRLLMHWFSEKSCLIYPASWQRCQQLHQWLLATSTSSHHEISHNSLCILFFYTVISNSVFIFSMSPLDVEKSQHIRC